MITRLLLLGMGTIQRSLAELLYRKKHRLLRTKEIICICPEDVPKYVYDIYQDLKHIKIHLTEDNQDEILNQLMNNKTICIDLTVNTDSIKIIEIARANNCLYINTSIEEYKKDNIMNPEKRTLYYQNIQLQKSLKKQKSNISIIESGGVNPGLISNFTMMAIHKYCEDYNPKYLKYLKSNKWAYVASKCVKMIHCAEKDTQQTNYKPKKNHLYNTWSPSGLISESLSPSFISSPIEPNKNYVKSKYNKNMYINANIKSMDAYTESYIINPDNKVEIIKGRMITHNEIVSMSDLFSTKNYVPIISYVYHCCDIASKSLELMKENDYKEPNILIPIYQEDVINKDSYDSMGSCVFFNDGCVYWCGTVLSNNQTLKIMGEHTHTNCTQLQVSISVLAYIEYLLKNKYKGVMTSEDLYYKNIIKFCIPYLGKFICKQII